MVAYEYIIVYKGSAVSADVSRHFFEKGGQCPMNDRFIQSVIFDWDRIDDDSYLKEIAAFDDIRQLDFNSPVTFFSGENGSGKSTLLEAIAIAYGFNP